METPSDPERLLAATDEVASQDLLYLATFRINEEKTERAAPGPPVVVSERPSRACPICGRALSGRQWSACSDRCRAALSRRTRAENQIERDRRVRELLAAALRMLAKGSLARRG